MVNDIYYIKECGRHKILYKNFTQKGYTRELDGTTGISKNNVSTISVHSTNKRIDLVFNLN